MGLKGSWQTFVRAIKLSYEHIGKVMITNLIWFGIGFSLFLLFTYLPIQNDYLFLIALLGTPITLGGVTGAVHYRMNRVILGEDSDFRDVGVGLKKYFVKGAVLYVLAALGFAILVFNIWFSQQNPSTLFIVLSGFWIWGIVFWLAVQQFVFPFLVNQKIGVLGALKKSSLMVLDNVLASLLLVVFSIVIIALSLVLAAPIMIFVASFLSVLQNCFYHELMVKYEDNVLEEVNSEEVEGEDQA
ncbi:MAG: hypothetical protein GX971_02005 [Firmicutes bacterium]|nr:hypothetical protein [Bacillota bacterium]